MILFSSVLLLFYLYILVWTLSYIVQKGRVELVVIFFILFLPFNQTLQIVAYQLASNIIVVSIVKYSKDLVVLLTALVFIFYNKNIFTQQFRFHSVDLLFLSFLGLGFLFAILPIGEADYINRFIYFKNLSLMGIAYLIGRNSELDREEVLIVVKSILILTVGAFLVAGTEFITQVHFQKIIGFTRYYVDVLEGIPKGNYDLTWTFQTSSGYKRFAAFFANPLEFSSAMLMSISSAYILFKFSKHKTNQILYLAVLVLAFLCIYFAFSRSSFVASLLLIAAIAYILRYYRLIFVFILATLFIVAYVSFLAPKELQDFVYDTVMFRNPSSFGHLLEWLEALDSLVRNPEGIGLAVSGNVGGVDSDLKIGGENQYLVIGVQMGVLGMLIYIGLLFQSIRTSIKCFNTSTLPHVKMIAFIAASFRIAFLLPLFTANAENYTYVSLVSWWMIGFSVRAVSNQTKSKSNLKRRLEPIQ